MKIQENVPLGPLTTFKIGGSARYFVEVKTQEDVQEAIRWAHKSHVKFMIFSGGSKILVPDAGIDKLVIQIASRRFDFEDNELDASAGCNLMTLIQAASEKSLGGWEKLAGIPGSIGGAVRGNAGAFGSEIKDFITKVKAINLDSGEIRMFSNVECAFEYRNSFFKRQPEWFVTRAWIRLKATDAVKSTQLIEETVAEREKRHLQNVKAAGSFFMNPVAPQHIIEMFEKEKAVKSREGRVPAGWLIEKAGMKGAKVGGAQASMQHPNYIVNASGATSEDVNALAAQIKKAVQEQFGITLEEEAAVL